MNKAMLIGNLTRDPEQRTTPAGVTLCSFGLAVNRRAGQGQQETDFYNITAFRTLGENCAKYLQKGRKVAVIGNIQIRTYDAQDGTRRTSVDIIADDVEFLYNKADSTEAGEFSSQGYSAPQQQGYSSAPRQNFAAAQNNYSAPQSSAPDAAPAQPAAPAFNNTSGFTQVDNDELPF